MKKFILILLISLIFIGYIPGIMGANDIKKLSAKAIFTTGLTKNKEPVTVLKDVIVNGERVYIYVTNRKEISINEENIYLYVNWGSLSMVEHNCVYKIFDAGGRLLTTNSYTFKPDKENWNTWTGYDIKKDVDKPGYWKFEVYLDNKQILEEYLLVKEEIPSKSCLWRINTINNSVYFLGSIHILKKEVYPLNESIEKAFENSRLIAFEIDFESENNKEAQKEIELKGTLPQESTLENSLSRETYGFIRELLKKYGLDISQFNKFKPWYLGILLSNIILEELGFKEEYGIDNYFYLKAKDTGKEILGLETLKDRSNLLDDMPTELQELYVSQALLGDKYLIENELDAVQIAWQYGDITKMEEIVLRDFKQDPAFYNALIIERNNNWLPKIRSLLKENKNCMIIVGAAHLFGENGLLDILKKEGYIIEQL